MIDFIVILIAVAAAFCVGFFVGGISSKMDGLFIVDDSDTETTRWVLDVKIDPKTIPSKKWIRLKVQNMTEGDV